MGARSASVAWTHPQTVCSNPPHDGESVVRRYCLAESSNFVVTMVVAQQAPDIVYCNKDGYVETNS